MMVLKCNSNFHHLFIYLFKLHSHECSQCVNHTVHFGQLQVMTSCKSYVCMEYVSTITDLEIYKEFTLVFSVVHFIYYECSWLCNVITHDETLWHACTKTCTY
jgi:hypothetical protein